MGKLKSAAKLLVSYDTQLIDECGYYDIQLILWIYI